MGRFLVRSAAVLALAGTAVAFAAGRMAEAPPPGVTGGFGETSCASCHLGSEVNAFGGRVRIVGLPEAYAPGRRYLVTVVLEADETAVAGFQMTARWADGPRRSRNAGALAAVDERTLTTDSAGVTYLSHSRLGSTTGDPSGSSWTIAWTAPSTPGAVVLHVAANSGNGDNSPLGDLVYTDSIGLPAEDVPVARTARPSTAPARVR